VTHTRIGTTQSRLWSQGRSLRGGNSSASIAKCSLTSIHVSEYELTLLLIFRIHTLPRSDNCETFNDENPQPPIGNLMTHTNTHAKRIKAAKSQSQTELGSKSGTSSSTKPPDHGYTMKSTKLMEEFLLEGKLNPKIELTHAGFLKLFATWTLEQDLLFTTGEVHSLKTLFQYLEVMYQLPTDTTVHNTLAHIFASLHATVVEELSVSGNNYW